MCLATVHIIVHQFEDSMEVVFQMPSIHGRADTALTRLLYFPWRRAFPDHIQSTNLYLEDLETQRPEGCVVRIVRRGLPWAAGPERYDLGEFVFCIQASPIVVHEEDITNPPINEAYNLVLSAHNVSQLFCEANTCTVVLAGHPLDVCSFFHAGRPYRTRNTRAKASVGTEVTW